VCENSTGRSQFVTEIIRNWTGAPGSPKRTWAENDIFECFQLGGSAAPNGFSWTGSLKRSWASPGFPARGATNTRVCGFLQGKLHEVRQRQQARQEIRSTLRRTWGHQSSSYCVRLRRPTPAEWSTHTPSKAPEVRFSELVPARNYCEKPYLSG
jgi:hypothetical protein